jgi:hypothetical protein
MTIKQFCERHQISESKYIKLRKTGRGPRELMLGPRSIRITEEADREWLAAMEEYKESQELRRERERQLELSRLAARRSFEGGNHVNQQHRRVADD